MGLAKSRLYRIWINMKSRCYNPNVPAYKNYGGRGITICDEWVNDFIQFKRWAEETGIKYATLKVRYRNGCKDYKSLTRKEYERYGIS